MDRRRTPALAACLLAAALALTGCGTSAGAAPADAGRPARVVHLTGSQRSAVVLTADAARRIGVTTAATTTAGGSAVAVPLEAVLYDKDGRTWVYTAARPLTFVPTQVTVAHIDGDTATLSTGPAVGTQVVTVGGAELVGVEYGVPGEQ
ncbi:MAG: hypothetical protein ACTHJL_12820 [Amnibacterium sp.]